MSALKGVPGGPKGPPGVHRRLVSLIIGALLLGYFAFGFLPFLSNFLGFRQAHDVVIEEGIEAGAFFYTGVTKIREIEPRIRSLMAAPTSGTTQAGQ
ncbi:MAG: hypothetical protein ACOY9Y_01550 [Bacillota bacterium]